LSRNPPNEAGFGVSGGAFDRRPSHRWKPPETAGNWRSLARNWRAPTIEAATVEVYDQGMPKSPPPDLDLREALEPFTAEEVRQLRRYVQLATNLRESRFFEQYHQKLEIRVSPEEGVTFDLPHGQDDEAITTMVARLRTLHTKGRAGTASFPRTARLLRAHTIGRDNASADWIRKVLDHYQAQVELATSSALIGLVKEHQDAEGNIVNEPVSPDEPFWDWIYGVYLHDDPDRFARVEAWSYIGAHKFNFLKMASDLAKVYFSFFGIVRDVLEEPDLVPSA
jgi:hypothetical protein